LIHQAKPEEQGGLRVEPWNARGLINARPTGFPIDMTTSRGSWLGPRTGAKRGATPATPNLSRIGQTSRIHMKSNFCIKFRTPFLDPTRIVTAPQPSLSI
jgi:hypothetical protein